MDGERMVNVRYQLSMYLMHMFVLAPLPVENRFDTVFPLLKVPCASYVSKYRVQLRTS
jgi:hypothetical protein